MNADAPVVLFSKRDHESVRDIDFPGSCTRLALGELGEEVLRAATVVVSGHSLPPRYLHREPRELACIVSRFRPDVLVLDSCYGFSLPLLEALAGVGLECRVVGASFKLPPRGLVYGRGLVAVGVSRAERAAHVRTASGRPLERVDLDPARLAAARKKADGWSGRKLRENLQRVHPNLVRVCIPGGRSTVLAPIDPARFRAGVDRE